jgi:hypothetical protein
MKAAINIEFMVSVFIFLSVIISTVIIIERELVPLEEMTRSEDVKTKGYYISDMLIFDRGFPENWDSTNVGRIGLSAGENYLLSLDKIQQLDALCTEDYARMRRILGQVNDIGIGIRYLNGESILDCNARGGDIELFVERDCIVNGRIAILNVTVIR